MKASSPPFMEEDDTTSIRTSDLSPARVALDVQSQTTHIDPVDEKLRKRLKHREYVKKSYQKKLRTIDTLKKELETLERQYNTLLQGQKDNRLDESGEEHQSQSTSPLLRQYMELVNVKTRYQQENIKLYELNAEYMKAEHRIQQLCGGTEGQYPRGLNKPLATSVSRQPRFHFTSLPDAEYAKIIATARNDILKFAYDNEKLSSGSRVFGWTDQRKIVGEELKFALEKEFPQVSASVLQARSWSIFSSPEQFAKIYSSSLNLKFYALQHINEDTHLFFRTVQVDGSDFIAKTVFLVARLRIDDGYMVMFRAIDPASVSFRENEGNRVLEEIEALSLDGKVLVPRKEVWVDKYSWVIFQEQGSESCLFHFGGSTLSTLWLKEVLFIALRWESMAIGPPIMLEM